MSGPARSERGVALRGEPARTWLAGHGYAADGESLRVVADSIDSPDFALERIWHDAPTLVRTAGSSGRLALTLLVDGSPTIADPPGLGALSVGEGFVHPLDRPVTLRSDKGWAMVIVLLAPDLEERYWLDPVTGVELVPQGSGAGRALLGLATATLSGPITGEEDEWPFLRESLESASAAVIASLGRVPPAAASAAAARTIRRARALIREHAADPDFTVETLARRLSVSRRTLQTAFAASGSTPRTEIRARRTSTARTILARRGSRTTEDLEEVARLAGFRTGGALREALRGAPRVES